MAKRVFTFLSPTLACCALAFVTSPAFGQPEVMAWGNISGIRVDGQLMELGSSLCVAHPEWTAVTRTAQERQATSYARTGKLQTVKLQMQGRRPVPPGAPPRAAPPAPAWTLSATQSVEEIGTGKARSTSSTRRRNRPISRERTSAWNFRRPITPRARSS